MEDKSKGYAKIVMPFVLFLVIGASLSGTAPEYEPDYIVMHEECYDNTDNNNDGDVDFINAGCVNYPYEDGSGETTTPNQARYTSSIEYQTGYDIFADYTLYMIDKACNGQASQCGINNVNDEVELFCYLDSNGVNSFDYMVQQWAIQSNQDDGSYQQIQDLCYVFGGSGLTTLPTLNYRQFY